MNDEQGSRAYRRKLSTPEAAAYIGLGESTLNKSRVTKTVGSTPAPPYIKLGARVLYDADDLDQWLAQNKRRSTCSVGANMIARLSKNKRRRLAATGAIQGVKLALVRQQAIDDSARNSRPSGPHA